MVKEKFSWSIVHPTTHVHSDQTLWKSTPARTLSSASHFERQTGVSCADCAKACYNRQVCLFVCCLSISMLVYLLYVYDGNLNFSLSDSIIKRSESYVVYSLFTFICYCTYGAIEHNQPKLLQFILTSYFFHNFLERLCTKLSFNNFSPRRARESVVQSRMPVRTKCAICSTWLMMMLDRSWVVFQMLIITGSFAIPDVFVSLVIHKFS